MLMPGGLLCIGLSFAAIPMVTSLLQLIIVYCFAAAVYQAVRLATCAAPAMWCADQPRTPQVSVAAHTLIAQQHGDGAGPHLNGINALFGAGSLLAPAMHRVVAPTLASHGPLASYWVIAAAACVAALPFVGALPRPKPPGSSTSRQAGHSATESGVAWTARTLVTVVLAMALVACNVGVRATTYNPKLHAFSHSFPIHLLSQAENCFGTWLYTYALGTSGSGAASGSVSLFWGSFTAGRLLAIPVSARVAPGTILLASLPLAVLGPCIILLGASTGAAGLLYAGAVATGLGISTGE